MSLIAVGSSRAAPGVTTVVLALAATWPQERRVVIWEADPDGGVLAPRFHLGDRPGLTTLAAAIRQGRLTGEQLWQHTQPLPGGTPVVVGGESADQTHVILDEVGERLATWLHDHPDVDTIADVGRLSPSSPAVSIAETADVVVMVARPVLEELRTAAHRLHALAAAGPTAGWVLVGDGPYRAHEVRDAFGLPVFAEIPTDPRAAAVLAEGGSLRTLRRSMLIRAVRTLTEQLAQPPPTAPQSPVHGVADGAHPAAAEVAT